MSLPTKLYIIFILITFFTTGCNTKSGNVPETEHGEEHHHELEENVVELTSEQYQTAGIQLGNMEQRNLSNVIKVNGVLDVPPQNLVSISAPLGGFVKKTDLLQGMKIKKGQVVAVIENPEFIQLQQDYLESKSKLEYIQSEFERQKELSRENVTSAKTFQQATSEFKTLKARVSGIQEKLALAGINYNKVEDGKITAVSYIVSPINGYVTTVNVNIGKYVTPTDAMFEIVDTDHLHVELTVFEKDVPKIKEGQKIRYTLADDPSKERLATVYLIGRSISEDRTVRIHAHMNKEDINLLPGMYVKAVIETGSENVKALPERAIIQSGGNNFIFILKEERKENNEAVFEFEMLQIEKGVSENGFTEVKLPENFKMAPNIIVIHGAYSLLSKMKNTEEEGGHAH